MALIRPNSYEVLITPLVGPNLYGEELDVTKDVVIDDFVKAGGISNIKREVDNGDFDIGVFVFGSINLKCVNYGGKFSGINDYRSLFKYSRDKAKIIVNYYNGLSNTPDSSFRGLIDDRATKLNLKRSEITFKILSNDSIINREKISSGLLTDGLAVSDCIKTILQLPAVSSVLVYNESNINVTNDYDIDDGSKFDNLTIKKGLDFLLAVSNSVLVVEKDTDKMIVRSRDYNSGAVKNLYGHGDLLGRENIISITQYNEGLHRTFTSVTVNDTTKENPEMISVYGDNNKKFDFSFITDANKEALIAQDILDYWTTPKIELEVELSTREAKGCSFFDLVSVDFPYRLAPADDRSLPTYGVATYGDAIYPLLFGDIKINTNTAFKVVGIVESPKKMTTTLKLRQAGQTVTDGFFNAIATYYGSAIYGLDLYEQDLNLADPNTASVYGAALFGTVVYGEV